MKNRFIILSTVTLFSIGLPAANAQFLKKIQQKLQDKVDKKVDNVLNGSSGAVKSADDGSTGKKAKLPNLEEVYSFTPGSATVFSDNFATDNAGRMPKHWKSSGGGGIATVSGMPGKWLSLMARTTYKLTDLLAMPGNFTIEFDLVTRSTEAKDIGAMQFGFAKDNSNREYISDAYNSNAITASQLHFWNKAIHNASSDTKISNNLEFPLNNYANELIHIAIAVEGENMRVYVNKSKVLDTNMFKKGTIKYFYMSAPFDYEYNAMVYFGNFVIAK